jgi:rhodanese-related sulfurtransferase
MKIFRYIKCVAACLALAGILSGCSLGGQIMDGDGMVRTFEYTSITLDEAKEMMERDDGHVIVDVRREDEYAEGHIPGAILIPNESIEYNQPEELPKWEQVILVYCQNGVRSKEAAQKLADMGYENVYEFGGIVDWDGEIEKE